MEPQPASCSPSPDTLASPGPASVPENLAIPSSILLTDGITQTLEEFTTSVFSDLAVATKHANLMPNDDDHHYYMTFPPYKQKIANLGSRLLNLTQRCMSHARPKAPKPFEPYTHDGKELLGVPTEEITGNEKFDIVVDTLDYLLEAVV